MRPRHIALALVALTLAVAAEADPALDAVLEKLASDGRFSGAVVLRADGKESYARGFGWAEKANRRPFAPDTPSDGASIAKPMTAAAILLLAGSGRIDLDAPVVRHVPGFPYPDLSIRLLLAHSAGLPDYDAFQALLDAGKPVFTRDLLRETSRRFPQPAFKPGTAFEYCNLCYDTLGLVLEEVHRSSFGAIIRSEILGPAGATTSFARPARLADWPIPRTIGYANAGPGAARNDQLDNEGFLGGSNMMVSARDLATFAESWLSGPLRALRPTAVQRVEVGGKPSRIRLGSWYCNDSATICQYSGHHQGFDSLAIWNSGTGRTAAFVSNSSLPPWNLHRLQRALIASTQGLPASMPAEPEACQVPLPPETAVGRYQSPDEAIEIVKSGKALSLLSEGQPANSLFPVSPGTYYAPGLDAFICFDRGRRLLWFSAERDMTGERIVSR
jgi:CubicO group peptidase (beta-lactamase class C family)